MHFTASVRLSVPRLPVTHNEKLQKVTDWHWQISCPCHM